MIRFLNRASHDDGLATRDVRVGPDTGSRGRPQAERPDPPSSAPSRRPYRRSRVLSVVHGSANGRGLGAAGRAPGLRPDVAGHGRGEPRAGGDAGHAERPRVVGGRDTASTADNPANGTAAQSTGIRSLSGSCGGRSNADALRSRGEPSELRSCACLVVPEHGRLPIAHPPLQGSPVPGNRVLTRGIFMAHGKLAQHRADDN